MDYSYSIYLFLPALPEKMAGEWLPRPAAYRPAGTKKVRKNFFKKIGKSVTLFKLFSILYMNKKIGKENERQNAESA